MKLIQNLSIVIFIFIDQILSTKLLSKNVYLEGSQNWKGICKKGIFQSPVNIIVDKNTEQSKNFIRVNYAMPEIIKTDKLYYDGESLYMNIDLGVVEYFNLESNTKEIFESEKIELHLPSENLITRDGNTNRFILELQIHHKLQSRNKVINSPNNQINVKKAVISILFEIGTMEIDDKFFNQMGINSYNLNKLGQFNFPEKNSYLDQILHPPASYGPGFNYIALQGLINLINADTEIFFYNGSGNIPPCDEDTLWMVFGEPRAISRFQFLILEKLLSKKNEKNIKIGNNRSVVVI